MQPYTYIPASLLGMETVTNLAAAYVDNQTTLVWDRIDLDGVHFNRTGACFG